MQNNLRSPRMNLRSRLALTHGAVTLIATLVVEGVALRAMPFIAKQANWPFNAVLVSAIAGLIGLILGAWASQRLTRRLQHVTEVSNAWLRGNLSIRIADPAADDLGLLAGKLDLLAEHLEHDEQDLDELRERNARLSDQVRALTVVEERNRLARELHDSVKQHLFSLAMTTSAMRTRFDALPDMPDDLAEMVREAEATAQTAQHEMTRLIEDLRPGSLQERGLAVALNDYTLLFGAQEHILIYLEVQGNDALLPPTVAEALYRVAQEALHNVARHARATRADVHLHCIPEQVSLTIHDNGVGFDTTKSRRGLGLANMEERMMAIGGRLIIESQVGLGTTVQAEVALTPPAGFQTEIASLDKNRPNPTIENWAWLGQKLVIPVGQTWPWLPADQIHLRWPLVEATDGELLLVQHSTGFLGFKRGYSLQLGQQRTPLIWIHRSRAGYEWEYQEASWALRHVRGLSGRMVLTRNNQPLAAMQYQGRLLHTWSEMIYAGRGYRLSLIQGQPDKYVLADEDDDELLTAIAGDPLRVQLNRALPLTMLIMTVMRIVDELSSTAVVP